MWDMSICLQITASEGVNCVVLNKCFILTSYIYIYICEEESLTLDVCFFNNTIYAVCVQYIYPLSFGLAKWHPIVCF